MAITPDDDVIENYEQIKAARGCSWADLARDQDAGDPRLAAYMRGRDAAEQAPAERTAPPRGRRSAPKDQA